MESPLAILFYATLMWVMVQSDFLNSYRSAVVAGLLLSAMFLSRLDQAFFAIAFGIIFGLWALVNREWRTFKYLAFAGLVVGFIVVAYLAYNYFTVGMMMPASAILKSHFPVALGYFNDKFLILSRVLENPSRSDFREVMGKTLVMVLPAAIALVFLVWSLVQLASRRLMPLDRALSVTSLFVILLALYNFLYVHYADQGHWYFPVSTLFLTLLVIRFSGGFLTPQSEVIPKRSVVEMLAVAGLLLFYFVNVLQGDQNRTFTQFLVERAPKLQQFYAGQEPKIVEYDDGIISYATGFPSMSGLGFTLDAEGVTAKRANDLLALAYRRGHDRIMSFSYFNPAGLALDSESDFVAEKLGATFFLHPPEVAKYNFQVEYLSEDGRFAVIQFQPK
jgi:hypothetical protein